MNDTVLFVGLAGYAVTLTAYAVWSEHRHIMRMLRNDENRTEVYKEIMRRGQNKL
jgi:hypothetical protein